MCAMPLAVTAGPQALNLMLGWRCNARCVQCVPAAIGRAGLVLPDKWRCSLAPSVLSDLLCMHGDTVTNVTFCGFGEPLMHPEFPALIESIRRHPRPLLFSMTTNGSLLHEHPEVVDLPGWLVVSLDAAEKALYESIRRGLSFDRVLANMREFAALRQAPEQHTRANMVVLRRNASQVYALAVLLREVGFRGLAVIRGAYLDEAGIASEQMEATDALVLAQLARIRREFPSFVLTDYFQSLDGDWPTPQGACCDLPWSRLEFTPDGMAHPCCRAFDVDLGYWNESPWHGERITRLREQLANFAIDPQEFAACAACSKRGVRQ